MTDAAAMQPESVDLSVLFITYNRSDLLEISAAAVRDRVEFGSLGVELVVADDASDEEHQRRLRDIGFDKYAIAAVNGGLGRNSNNGIAAASGRYILQIQDDCEFVGGSDLITTAVGILESDPEVGTVQLTWQTPDVPHETRTTPGGARYVVFENDGLPGLRECGERPYSDQPHVKRREFCRDIGPYKEGVRMTDMELDYQRRVAQQTRWRVAYVSHPQAFRHLGSARSFNPSVLRARRIERLESYPVIGACVKSARAVVRQLRHLLKYRPQ